ncbi:MAG: hypothetical protein BGN88_06335 [Clostridiales bacterium 43-6]|nr:MAG: hypothetical protein BGN88_06335 [Clostridiales bacterium 43-6]
MEYMDKLSQVKLFKGLSPADIETVFHCLQAKRMSYKKGNIITHAGDEIRTIGIVVKGKVEVSKVNISGRKTILTLIDTGELFGEIISFANIKSPVTTTAAADSEIFFIKVDQMIHSCSNCCDHHAKLIQNMLMVIAGKNLVLNQKINYLLMKGMREKLANYMMEQAVIHNSPTFEMSYDRNSLADYLNVDRSAMSRELGRMRDEGLIEYYKSSVKILDVEALKSFC